MGGSRTTLACGGRAGVSAFYFSHYPPYSTTKSFLVHLLHTGQSCRHVCSNGGGYREASSGYHFMYVCGGRREGGRGNGMATEIDCLSYLKRVLLLV